jgi:hypothetical protein
MRPVRLIATFVENKPGQTAFVTKLLADAHVNIRWVTIANSGPFGVMKFLVDDQDRAHDALKQHGLVVSFLDVLPVEVDDAPGALQRVAQCLAQSQVNLDNVSGFVANRRAIAIIETHETDRARQALVAQGLRILTREELLEL